MEGLFLIELKELINRHSMENGSNTPDFLLAQYLEGCLTLWDETTRIRDQWYGKIQKPGAEE